MEPQEIKGLQCPTPANPFANLLTLSPTDKSYSSVTNLTMHPNIESTDHTLSHANLSENPDSSSSYFNRYISNSLIHVPLHMFSLNTSSLSADSTLHEQREHQPGSSNEKRLKRMISNRESARRSRMRRKKQSEELQCQVNQLQAMNHQLSEKVIRLLENNHQIVQENSQLKEKVTSLQIVVSDLLTPLRNVEESTTYNNNRLRGETSNRSTHY